MCGKTGQDFSTSSTARTFPKDTDISCSDLVIVLRMVSSRAGARISGGSGNFHFGSISLTTVSFLVLIFFSSLSSATTSVQGRGVRSFSHQKLAQAFTSEQLEYKDSHNKGGELQRFLEVARPISKPKHGPTCTMELLYHEFAATYGVDPPAVHYYPSLRCGRWDKVVLKWKAVCRGRQFDRIAGVWLGGVEILRTCTAEPTQRGIIWEVEKDVTRYAALWKKPQELVVAMGNVITDVYTGIFNVTVSVEFYRERGEDDDLAAADGGKIWKPKLHVADWHSKQLRKRLAEPAQVILPVAEPSYKGGGYWFQLVHEGESKNSSIRIPRNTYRAVLEVCVSPHQNDEFWYTNLPNDYLKANNLTDVPGNGAFREVQVLVDGQVVGAVWPFAVLYTGGVNPLFWRPLAAIGAFKLPSYDVDITPFLGSLLDGKDHVFSLSVTDNLDMWLLQANLHIWRDPHRAATSGGLESSAAPPVSKQVEDEFKGLDGTFNTTATRLLSYVGHVRSSFGNLTTTVSYALKFYNSIGLYNSSYVQSVDQYTESEYTVTIKSLTKEIAMYHDVSSYPLYLYYSEVENSDGSYDISSTLTHTLKTEKQAIAGCSSSSGFLTNYQSSDGFLYLDTNNTLHGVAGTKQVYTYDGTDGCYQRDISAKNYTVTSDEISSYCSHIA